MIASGPAWGSCSETSDDLYRLVATAPECCSCSAGERFRVVGESLLTDLHRVLGGRVIVVWDQLPGHVSRATGAYIEDNAAGLHVATLPG